MKKLRLIDISILFVMCGFLFSYVGISYFNRAMQDDFWFFARINSFGIWNSVVGFYMELEGAFGCFLWVHFLAWLNHLSTHIFLINLFNLAVLSFSLFLILRESISRIIPGVSIKISFYLTVLSVSSILFFQEDVKQQAVFWFNGSAAYMSSISLLLFGLYFLQKDGKINLIYSGCMLFLFSSVRLHYSLIEFGILFFLLVGYWLKERKLNSGLLFLFCFSLIGFILYLIAPGNYVGRFSGGGISLSSISLLAYGKLILHSLVYYGYVHVLKVLPWLILIFYLSFILGVQENRSSLSKKTYGYFLMFSVCVIAMGWLCLAVVMAVFQQSTGMSRTFFFPLFLTVVFANMNAYFFGVRVKGKVGWFTKFSLPVGLIAGLLMANFFYSDMENLKHFRGKYEERITLIEKAKLELTNSSDTLYLNKLPFTKSLMSNELQSQIYVDMQEGFLQMYHETPFRIKLVNEKK